MAQLHFYVPDEVEEQIRKRAEAARLPVSRYLAELVKRETATHDGWPDDYFQTVFGKWEGEPLERMPEGEVELRERFK